MSNPIEKIGAQPPVEIFNNVVSLYGRLIKDASGATFTHYTAVINTIRKDTEANPDTYENYKTNEFKLLFGYMCKREVGLPDALDHMETLIKLQESGEKIKETGATMEDIKAAGKVIAKAGITIARS